MLTIRVVKIGGGELDDPAWLERFARAFRYAEPAVIVHGGGRAISRALAARGLPVEMRDGIRVTPAEAAVMVREVLCGPVRATILRALRGAGVEAVGMAGHDDLLHVELVDGETLGRVGRVTAVETSPLMDLLTAGKTPVVAPVSVGCDGGVVNVNADEAASAIAGALHAAELLMISDVPGVMDRAGILPSVGRNEVEELIRSGVAQGGMAAKLRAARLSGAARVRIGDVDLLRSRAAGTRVIGRRRPAA